MQVMLIPAKHKSFYFTHWYAEFVQSVSSINFSLSDKKKRTCSLSPPYTTVGHYQDRQVTIIVIRSPPRSSGYLKVIRLPQGHNGIPRSSGHHQGHQVTTKVIRSPPRSSGN